MALVKGDKDDTSKVNHLNSLSSLYKTLGNLDTSMYYVSNGMKLSKQLNFTRGIAKCYNIMGNVYVDRGDYPNALDNYFKAKKVNEDAGNKSEVAKNLSNIGSAYKGMGDYKKALDYDFQALKIYQDIGSDWGIANTSGNIGNIYDNEGIYKDALDYDMKSLVMFEKIGDKTSIARNTGNIGNVYDDLGKYDEALEYDFKSLEMYKALNDEHGIALNIGNIGNVYSKTGKYAEAEKYLTRAIALCDSIHFLSTGKEYNLSLSKLYVKTGQWQKAYNTYIVYTTEKDSLVNLEKSKQLGRVEAKADYDKQLALQQADDEKKIELANANAKREKILIAFVAAIALAVTIIALIISRALQVTRRQKTTIEIKSKEINDSIAYAKRLQDAILPPVGLIEKHLSESFVLYKPKDIVAGDFYWLERVGDKILIAAADCTGHGVPGALVSVVCSNVLNRAVNEFHLTEPGKILDKARELLLDTFSQRDTFGEKSAGDIMDGMDISLVAISLQPLTVSWSGAYNPLWYIQAGEMKELMADKQPVGKYEASKPFTTTTLNLNKGDILYLFTDGYADQFGGPKGKKFKYKQFQEKLLAISQKPLAEQARLLNETFENWKGKNEQTDDVCIIGVRV